MGRGDGWVGVMVEVSRVRVEVGGEVCGGVGVRVRVGMGKRDGERPPSHKYFHKYFQIFS